MATFCSHISRASGIEAKRCIYQYTRMSTKQQQRGIATILIILLTGLALLAVVLGLNSYMRISQEQGVTLQAQTQAQVKAWTGAEVVRRYLDLLLKNEDNNVSPKISEFVQSSIGNASNSDASYIEFNPPIDLQLTGIPNLSAYIVSIKRDPTDSDKNEYTIDVVSDATGDSRARSTSTLRLVYRVAEETNSKVEAIMDWRRDMNLSGSITVERNDSSAPYVLMVDGNVYTGGNSITNVDAIRSTGSIYISSGSSFKELQANGDIRINGSVSVTDAILARGDVCVEGGASARGNVRANGSVIATGGVQLGDVFSMAKSDNTQHDQLCAAPPSSLYLQKLNYFDSEHNNEPFGVDLQGNSSARSVQTKGSVRINSGTIHNTLLAQGDLVDTNWGGSEKGSIGGALRINNSNPAIANDITIVDGLNVAVSSVPELSSTEDKFDASGLKSSANYAFRIDENGYKVVDVLNIVNIEDGTYFIADYDNNQQVGWDRGYKDFLCKKLASNSTPNSPKCQPPVDKVLGTICHGYSNYNNCLSFANGQWKIEGTSMAPGILWFEGDLQVSNGTFYGTLIATGDISNSGGTTVYAPNYAGYDGWQGEGSERKKYAPTGICKNSNFPDKYPTNLCSDGEFVFDYANGIGNYALMAGSCVDTDCTQYKGGNIALSASNNIYGNVLAGNVFNSGGSTTVYGYITSLGLGNSSINSQGGSTTINLKNLPPNFKTKSGQLDTSTSSERFIQVRWSRYL